LDIFGFPAFFVNMSTGFKTVNTDVLRDTHKGLNAQKAKEQEFKQTDRKEVMFSEIFKDANLKLENIVKLCETSSNDTAACVSFIEACGRMDMMLPFKRSVLLAIDKVLDERYRRSVTVNDCGPDDTAALVFPGLPGERCPLSIFVNLLASAIYYILLGQMEWAAKITIELTKHYDWDFDTWKLEEIHTEMSDLSYCLFMIASKAYRNMYYITKQDPNSSKLEGLGRKMSCGKWLNLAADAAGRMITAAPERAGGYLFKNWALTQRATTDFSLDSDRIESLWKETVEVLEKGVSVADQQCHSYFQCFGRWELASAILAGGKGDSFPKQVLVTLAKDAKKQEPIVKNLNLMDNLKSACRGRRVVQNWIETSKHLPNSQTCHAQSFGAAATGYKNQTILNFAQNKCDACGKTFAKVKKCGGCRKQQYCGPDCQKKAWKAHKPNCKK